MRRALITLIVLVVLGTGGVWVYQNYFAQTEEPPATGLQLCTDIVILNSATRGQVVVNRGTALHLAHHINRCDQIINRGATPPVRFA